MKNAVRRVRRRAELLNQNIFSAHMAKAHAAIPDRPPQKRHCTEIFNAAAPFCFMHKFRRKNTLHFWKETTHCLWNILRKFCIIELWSTAHGAPVRLGYGYLPARFCEPKRGQKAADCAFRYGIGVALEWHDRGHRSPAPRWSTRPRRRPAGGGGRSGGSPASPPPVPTCAHGGRMRGNLTCARAIPLILPGAAE